MTSSKSPVAWLRQLVAFLSSLGLAAAIFIFLLLLTYLGTIEQIESGLYLTQKKYFESLFLVHTIGLPIFGPEAHLPIPLPGVRLLLVLLFINIMLGGILRMRKGWSQLGVLIVHGGILLLLVGGFITYEFAIDGHMTLYEQEQSNVFESYHEWELAIARVQDGTKTEFVVPADRFASLSDDEELTLKNGEMPFELTVYGYSANATPRPKGPMFEVPYPVVDGFYLEPLPLEPEHERNVAGVYSRVTGATTDEAYEAVLWGMQQQPASFTVGGETWTLDLRRRRWEVPFTIVLDDFRRELHPRTSMAKAFESDVIKVEDGIEQKINISMNRPLRHKGYTFFQASWGPQNAAPGARLFSSFAVVRNPADKFPLYACIVITFGMLVHFSMRLRKYLRAEGLRQT